MYKSDYNRGNKKEYIFHALNNVFLCFNLFFSVPPLMAQFQEAKHRTTISELVETELNNQPTTWPKPTKNNLKPKKC